LRTKGTQTVVDGEPLISSLLPEDTQEEHGASGSEPCNVGEETSFFALSLTVSGHDEEHVERQECAEHDEHEAEHAEGHEEHESEFDTKGKEQDEEGD